MTPDISLTMLAAGRADFAAHYSVNGNQNFAPDVTVKWDDLKNAVEVNGGISNKAEIALRLIHMYDGTIWFLTMEVCQLDMVTKKIIAKGNRFTLKNGTVTPSNFPGNYDPNYFSNVLCDNQTISPDRFVNNVIFPWYQQIAEMHCQNNLPDDDPTIFVNFAACSYDYSAYVPKASLVPFPHTVVIFMSATEHGDYVDDADYTEMFTNRAADMATVCPPCCDAYYWPATLPVVPTCLNGTGNEGGNDQGNGGGDNHGNE